MRSVCSIILFQVAHFVFVGFFCRFFVTFLSLSVVFVALLGYLKENDDTRCVAVYLSVCVLVFLMLSSGISV